MVETKLNESSEDIRIDKSEILNTVQNELVGIHNSKKQHFAKVKEHLE